MQVRFAPLAFCLTTLACAGVSSAQDNSKLVVSLDPLTAEQLTIYRTILAGWIDKDTPMVNLADQTVPLGDAGPSNGSDCGQGLDLESLSPSLVHQFRVGDLTQLVMGKIRLVERKRGEKDVKGNDPWGSIQKGQPVDDAVSNGFAHGLFTLSEIQFDKKHEHAIVSYGFVCGALCGNGSTVIMKKNGRGWREMKRCDDWVSSLPPAPTCITFSKLY